MTFLRKDEQNKTKTPKLVLIDRPCRNVNDIFLILKVTKFRMEIFMMIDVPRILKNEKIFKQIFLLGLCSMEYAHYKADHIYKIIVHCQRDIYSPNQSH